MNYIGTYNASTNTPTLVNGVGTKDDFYIVSVAGVGVNGLNFVINDHVIYNGSVWYKYHPQIEVGKININFTVIPDYDPATLIVGDLSDWKGAENLPATICITPPGSKKSINNVFQKHRLNIFNSVNLGLSCVKECEEQTYNDLPDGVWTITLKSGYEDIEKTVYYLKTDRFQLEIDKAYTRAGLEFDKEQKQFREDMQDIHFLSNSAHAWVRQGDFARANRDFVEAQTVLKKWIDCKNCL